MYVLILTLLSYRSSSIAQVSGFPDLKTCLAAGNDWIIETREVARDTNNSIRALCVKVS
jgi:hypothetical protein